ncbi:MAG: DUF4838 domain-containing protein, partial [Lentisphaeria bacterium]|nr:DUF4838 domain-containing protein [Lentisphaeria bacterium]
SVCISSFAYNIVIPANPKITEKTAKAELEKYMKQCVNKLFVGKDEIRTIYVGDTDEALFNALERKTLKDDSYIIKKIGRNIVINGGGTRGVIYGVYDFLENVCGVRFLTQLVTYIPPKGDVKISSVDKKFDFFFPMRDIFIAGKKQLPLDGGKFAMSRGMSRDGERPITAKFGGGFDYGPPYFCHTYDRYIPASKYLKTHPHYFSLRDGKRYGGQTKGQLCMTNPELKKFFLSLILDNIKKTTAQAKKEGRAIPLIYDISSNDNGRFCRCETCAPIAEAENNSGLMIQFSNWIAREVKKVYPDVKLQIFAYTACLEPPKTIKPDDNIIVRVCNTGSDQITGAPSNPDFVKTVNNWKKLSNGLYVWDYGIIYQDASGLPYPSEFGYPAVFKYYADNGFKGQFWELEAPDRSDMWELKFYMLSKYIVDPYRKDFDVLLDDFCDKYYGKAGKYIAKIRRTLYEASKVPRTVIGWVPNNGDFEFIDWKTMDKCQQLFAQARQAAGNDKTLQFRIDKASMGLDRLLSYEAHRRYLAEFAKVTGKPKSEFPYNIPSIRKKFLESWQKSIDYFGFVTPQVKKNYLQRFANIDLMPIDFDPAPEFANIPHLDITPGEMPLVVGREMTIIKDKTSPIGVSLMIDADKNRKTYKFPMTFGMYNKGQSKGIVSKVFQKDKFIPNKYQWVKVANVKLPDSACYLWLTNSWKVQIPLNNIAPVDRKKPITAHIHVKFEGDLYYNDGKPSHIYIDRVIITN